MKRNAITKQLIIATGLALAPFAASADDNSMSVLTGDSYAYFNGLEFRLGQLSLPGAKTMVAGDRAQSPAAAGGATRLPLMLAGPMPDRMSVPGDAGKEPSQGAMRTPRNDPAPAKGVYVPSPFRDDTGQ